MEEERKLKRGLKDLSPLFQKRAPVPKPLVEASAEPVGVAGGNQVEVLSVFSPDFSEESFFWNTYLAAQLACERSPASIFSILSRFSVHRRDNRSIERRIKKEVLGPYLERFSLSMAQFDRIITHFRALPKTDGHGPHFIFLDFEYYHIPYLEKIIPVMDKWILVLPPTFEGLSEGYKMMKAVYGLNSRLEFFLIFQGYLSSKKAGYLFERFSQLAARQLGVALHWLGCAQLAGTGKRRCVPLSLEPLFFESRSRIPTPAQLTMMSFVQSFQGAIAEHVG